MRSVLCLLSVSVWLALVAAGLNISNQGINDLTLNNPGHVIAIHLEDKEVYVEALGSKYLCSRVWLQEGQARLATAGAWIRSCSLKLLQDGQAGLEKAAAWVNARVRNLLSEAQTGAAWIKANFRETLRHRTQSQ